MAMPDVITEILAMNFKGNFINSDEVSLHGVSEIFDKCPSAQELCIAGEGDREQVVEYVRASEFLSCLIR
jgi:hypothetical protein